MIKQLCKKAVKYIITMFSAVITILLNHNPVSDKELNKTPFHNPEHPWEEPCYNDYFGLNKDQGTSAATGTSTVLTFHGTDFIEDAY